MQVEAGPRVEVEEGVLSTLLWFDTRSVSPHFFLPSAVSSRIQRRVPASEVCMSVCST